MDTNEDKYCTLEELMAKCQTLGLGHALVTRKGRVLLLNEDALRKALDVAPKLLTFQQFAEKHPAFPVSTLRWKRYQQAELGLEGAFVKDGGRVLVNESEFFRALRREPHGEKPHPRQRNREDESE